MSPAKNPLPKPQKKITRIDRAIQEVISGESADPLLKTLSEDDQKMLYEALAELRQDPSMSSAYMSDLWRLDYTKRPPSMLEFLEDPYWLGGIMNKSEESEGIFPKWKEVLVRDFDIDSRIHNLVVTGSLGIGKCWKPDEKVLTFDLRKVQVKDVKPGDLLMGDDSTPRRVVNTVTGIDEMFKIVPTKGESFTVTGDHILVLVNTYTGKIVQMTVKEYLSLPKQWMRDALKLFRTGVELETRETLIDPYWLGLWLGNGSSHDASITISEEDVEIFEYHKSYCESFGLLVEKHGASDTNHSYVATASISDKQWKDGVRPKNPLLELLRAYGLSGPVGTGQRKRIPKDYLLNSREVRLKLLAGLIDSDGGKGPEGQYGITSVFETLADDIELLARSLGYLVKRKIKKSSIKKTGFIGYYHDISISGAHDVPVLLPRKKSQPRRQAKDWKRTGFVVVPVGLGSFAGFEVEGTNRRLLMHDFTVTHNTFCTVTILLYRIVLARLLRNPQAFFGLAKGSQIFYAILSVTRSVVQETAFGDVLNFMSNSPFFIEECKFNPNKKYSNLRIPLGGNVFMTAGSQGWHIIGRNAMGVALDEGNFRLESNPDLKAYKLYDEVRTRIRNRFQKMAGFMPAISILSSSARDESSFTEKVINDIEESKDADQRVYRYPVYKIKAHTLKLSNRWFKVAYGLKNVDPFILKGWYDKDGDPIGDEPHENAPSGAKTELVPDNYFSDFKRNVKTNLQSISGISTGGSFRFFGNTLDLERSIAMATELGIVNPCTVTSIALSEENNKEIWDFLDPKIFLTKRMSQIMPKRDPNAVRYCHLDLATRTQAGLSICHAVGKTKVEGITKIGGETFDEYRIIVEYDFILSIVAGNLKPISIEKVIKFLFWLRDVCGYRFAVVTADQYQSALPLQMLEKAKFKVANLSVDKTKKPYEAWRSGFEEGRIRMFHHSILMSEAENLVDMGDRVDHPDNNSKDVADSACGAYFSAITFKDANSLKSPHGGVPGVYSNMDLVHEEAPPVTVVDLNKLRKPPRSFDA